MAGIFVPVDDAWGENPPPAAGRKLLQDVNHALELGWYLVTSPKDWDDAKSTLELRLLDTTPVETCCGVLSGGDSLLTGQLFVGDSLGDSDVGVETEPPESGLGRDDVWVATLESTLHAWYEENPCEQRCTGAGRPVGWG